MAVSLDAPAAKPAHGGHGPIWRVGCDACRDRLYLAGFSAKVAAQRAEREFGWRRVWVTATTRHMLCRRCGGRGG